MNTLLKIAAYIFVVVVMSLAFAGFVHADAIDKNLLCRQYAALSTQQLDACLKCQQRVGLWDFGSETSHNTVFYRQGVPPTPDVFKKLMNASTVKAVLNACVLLETDRS